MKVSTLQNNHCDGEELSIFGKHSKLNKLDNWINNWINWKIG